MRKNQLAFEGSMGEIFPFLLFETKFQSLFYLVESHKNDKWYSNANPATQVSLIGLFAHFEAFCKHQFAAIINFSRLLYLTFAKKEISRQWRFLQ